jgi:hypothetical protein
VSVQAAIVDLLRELRIETVLSMLISRALGLFSSDACLSAEGAARGVSRGAAALSP